MRRPANVYIILFIAFLVSCTSTDKKHVDKSSDIAQNDIKQDSIIAFKMNVLLSEAFPKKSLKWASFFLIDSTKENGSNTEPFEEDGTFYQDYAPILKWSADSNYILDLNSYGLIPEKDEKGKTHLTGGDPEVGVGLIDRRAGKRLRLFYMGPHGGIFDGLWIDSANVAFIGEVEDLASKDTKYDTLAWIYNRTDSIKKVYKFSP